MPLIYSVPTMAGKRSAISMGTNGLLVADPEANPHLLMAGTGGSGKSRFGLPPLLTSSGWQIAIYGRSGPDFLPFQQHPNAHVVLLDDPSHAIDYLVVLCEITQRRFVTLREAGVSTWGRLPSADRPAPPPAPRLLAVMDEFAPTHQRTAGLVAQCPRDCRRGSQGRRPFSLGFARPHPQEPGLTLPAQLPASLLPCKGRRCQSRHSGCLRCRAAAAEPVHDGDGPSLTRRSLCSRR